MSDVFALAIVGAEVRLAGSNLTGRITQVMRMPRREDGSMPAYVKFEHDEGVLIVPTTCLRLAGPVAVAAE